MLRLAALAALASLGASSGARAQTSPAVDTSGFTGSASAPETEPPAGYVALIRLAAGDAPGGRVAIARSSTAVELRPRTVVEVFAPAAEGSRAPDIAVLASGSVRVTSGPFGARVDAGPARATLVNGDARVSRLADGAAISNHGQLPLRVVLPADGMSLTVPAGHGVSTRGAAEVVELPATPAVSAAGIVGLSSAGAPFHAEVQTAAGVTAVAAIRRAGETRPIAVFETAGPRFTGGGLGAGRHAAKFWARADSGLESEAGAPIELDVSLVDVVEPWAEEPAGASPQIADPWEWPALLPGTTLRLPAGDCVVGVTPPPSCAEVPVRAVEIRAELAEARPLVWGRPTTIRISVDSDAELDLSRLRLQAGDAVLRATRTEPGHIDVALQPLPDTSAVKLAVALGPAIIARFELAVANPPRPPSQIVAPAPERRGPRTAWELGGMIGVTLVDDENALGNAPTRSGRLDGGAVVGLRAAYAFTDAVSAEAEATYSQPGFVELDDHANVLSYRIGGRAFLSNGRVRPFAALGFGGAYLSTDSDRASNDADIEAYWGLGVRLAIDAVRSLRIDLRHRVGPGRIESVSNTFEATLGASFRL